MITLTCPWCAEDALLALTSLIDATADFTCDACGTMVALMDEPRGEVELEA